ncbi:MAG: thioredoxin [Clostridiales bacterium]|nr:thioredoxin [Clostridiales bacterium]MBO4687575.1 thioredoxin [Clostridiales bacterium]
MAEITLTPDNFDSEVLKSSLPVLVDFWATWCGPCQMLAPILEEFANENEGKIKVGKVNVDEARELAMEYRISSIPTLILFENGEAKKMTLGLQTKEKLQEFIS